MLCIIPVIYYKSKIDLKYFSKICVMVSFKCQFEWLETWVNA